MYITDTFNYRVRKVTASTGIITLVAGTGATSYAGDGGAATAASFNLPFGIAVDSTGTYSLILHSFSVVFLNSSFYLGNVYFADYGNHRIRKVTVSTGIITTFAGTGTSSFSGDNGPATAATFSYPVGVGIDASGTHSPLLL